MSEDMNEDPNEWVAQAFWGPIAIAEAAKASMDEQGHDYVGACNPPQGAPPMLLDTDGAQAIFAVLTRRAAPMAPPNGMLEVTPSLAGRFI